MSTKSAQRNQIKRKRKARRRQAPRAAACAGIERSFITADFEKTGIANLLIWGRTETGCISGAFYLDLCRVGVVDCFAQLELSSKHYREDIAEAERDDYLRAITPTDAHKVLLTALRYSRELGLSPDNVEEIASLFLDDPREEPSREPGSELDERLLQLADLPEDASPEDPENNPTARMDAHQSMLLDGRIEQLTLAADGVECIIGKEGLGKLLLNLINSPQNPQLQ